MKPDLVVMRVWNDHPQVVFALFPTIPADNTGNLCTSYQHIGQHCAADYHICIGRSRPATRKEAKPLLDELKQVGYRPRVIHRALPSYHKRRKAEARGAA